MKTFGKRERDGTPTPFACIDANACIDAKARRSS